MTRTEYRNKISQLAIWNKEYHNGTPTVEDYVYDTIYKEVKGYEKVNNLSSKVTTTVGCKDGDRPHVVNMYSQKNAYDDNDIKKWDRKIRKYITEPEYVIEPKYDGISLELVYEAGSLVAMVTRGDGSVGRNVTHNLKLFCNIPTTLNEPIDICVYGEAVMRWSVYDTIKLDSPSSNPRNMTSGLVMSLSTKHTNVLDFAPWTSNVYKTNNVCDNLKWLTTLGFDIKISPTVVKFPEIASMYDKYTKTRNGLLYPVDGMLVKVNDITKHEIIGHNHKYPKWSIAYKFTPTVVNTKITEVVFNIGMYGTLTPVASVDPITITGSVISKVTLHNPSYITEHNIKINSNVGIIKSGDVIPKIVKVSNGDNCKDIKLTMCPVCHTPIQVTETEYICVNKECSGVVSRKIEHYVKRKYAYIDNLGSTTIDLLVTSGLVKHPVDLYRLLPIDLTNIGISELMANKIVFNIQKTKGMDLYRFISGVGIKYVGERLSKILATEEDLFNPVSVLFRKLRKELRDSYVTEINNTNNKELYRILYK